MRNLIIKHAYLILGGILTALLFAAGCASRGPAVDKPPSVQVSEFNSTVITPQLVKFRAVVLIRNHGSGDLDFERVDYAVDLFTDELFDDSFDGLFEDLGAPAGLGAGVVAFAPIEAEFFKGEVASYLDEEGLDPQGAAIIRACLDGAGVEAYETLLRPAS